VALTPAQQQVLRVFQTIDDTGGFALAGGGAMNRGSRNMCAESPAKGEMPGQTCDASWSARLCLSRVVGEQCHDTAVRRLPGLLVEMFLMPQLPAEVADMTVEEALQYSKTVRKLLISNESVK